MLSRLHHLAWHLNDRAAPDGSRVTRMSAIISELECFQLSQTGSWKILLISHLDGMMSGTATVMVTSEANQEDAQPVRMRTFFSTRHFKAEGASTQFKLYAELWKDDLVVVGARVLATVTTPLGNRVPIWLKDNGAGR